MLRLLGDVALPVTLPRPWGSVCAQRGGQMGARRLHSAVLSSPVQQTGLTTLAKALLPSQPYSPLLEELSHSRGDGRTSPFHSEFPTTGLFLENLPLENGKIYPFREEVYACHMAGDTK